jgi:hypothetical protein
MGSLTPFNHEKIGSLLGLGYATSMAGRLLG